MAVSSSVLAAVSERRRVAEAVTNASLATKISSLTNDPTVDAATTQLVRSIVANAERLGLVWRLRPATIAPASVSGATRVVVDGTTVPIRAVSVVGDLPVGARVMVVLTPPSGVHIVGHVGIPGALSATVGGTQWEASGGALSTGHAGTEALTGMSTGSLLLSPYYRHRIATKVLYLASTSATTTWWILRVRAGGLTGTQVTEQVFTTANTTYGEEREFTAAFRTTSATTTDYVLTCQRLSGSATLGIYRGGYGNQPYMVVHRDCGTQQLTWA